MLGFVARRVAQTASRSSRLAFTSSPSGSTYRRSFRPKSTPHVFSAHELDTSEPAPEALDVVGLLRNPGATQLDDPDLRAVQESVDLDALLEKSPRLDKMLEQSGAFAEAMEKANEAVDKAVEAKEAEAAAAQSKAGHREALQAQLMQQRRERVEALKSAGFLSDALEDAMARMSQGTVEERAAQLREAVADGSLEYMFVETTDHSSAEAEFEQMKRLAGLAHDDHRYVFPITTSGLEFADAVPSSPNYATYTEKVKLYVDLRDIGLCPEQDAILRELVGPQRLGANFKRKKPAGDRLKLVGEKFGTSEENQEYVLKLLRDLLKESEALTRELHPDLSEEHLRPKPRWTDARVFTEGGKIHVRRVDDPDDGSTYWGWSMRKRQEDPFAIEEEEVWAQYSGAKTPLVEE